MTRPSGLAAGDLLVLVASWSYDRPTGVALPSGFVEQARDVSQGTDSTSPNVVVAFRWVDDPAAELATYSASGNASAEYSAELVAVRNVDRTNPIVGSILFALTANALAQTIPTRDLAADSLWLGIWTLQRYTPAADNSFTLPSGVTPAAQHSGTFNFSAVGSEMRTAGTVPARTATASASASAGRVASLALRGASLQVTPESRVTGTTHFAPTITPEATLVGTIPAETSALGAIQTPSFTPQPGELLVVKGYLGHSLAAMSAPSGGGLSFASGPASNLASYTPVRIDTARVPTGGTGPMTVSATVTNSSNSNAYSPSLVVERWVNAKLLDPVATNAVKTGTTSQAMNPVLTTAAEGSVVSYAVGDWQPVTTGVAAFRSGAVANYAKRNSGVNYWSAWQRTTAVGGQVLGMTAPTGQKWTLVGVELARGTASAPAAQTLAPDARTATTTHSAPALAAGPANVAPDAGASSATHAAPAISAGTVAVSPPLATSATAHPVAAIGRGAVELRPESVTTAPASYSDPAVGRGPVDLRPDSRTGVAAHTAPALTPGAVELRPGVRSAATDHPAPALWVGAVELTPDGRSAAAAHSAPALAPGSVALAPDARTAAAAHPAPAVGRGAVELRPDSRTAATTHPAPAVWVGAVELLPAASTAATDHAEPTIGRGVVELVVDGPPATGTSYGVPAIGRGAVELRPESRTATLEHSPPAVTPTITPALGTAAAVHAAPAVGRGAVELLPESRTAAAHHSPPGVGAQAAAVEAVEQLVDVEHAEPVIERGPVDLAVELTVGQAEHAEPVIERGPVGVVVPVRASGAQHGTPELDRGPAEIAIDEHTVGVTHRTATVRRGPVELAVDPPVAAETVHAAAAVTPGPVVVRPAVHRPSTTHGVVTVWVGSLVLTPELATADAVSGVPAVGRGARRLGPELAAVATEHPAPLIVRGAAVQVVPGRLAITSAPDGLTVTDGPAPSRLEVSEAW